MRIRVTGMYGTPSIRRGAARPDFWDGLRGVGKATPHQGAGGRGRTPPATKPAPAPKPAPTPKPAPVTKDVGAEWRIYVGLLSDLVSGLRSGKYAPDSPLPPAPASDGPKGLMSKASDLINKTLPAARERARYVLSLAHPSAVPPTDSGGGGGGGGGSDQGGGGGGDSSSGGGNDAQAAITYPSITNNYAAQPAVQPQNPLDAPGAGYGTVIDPTTGQPIAASIMSNKWVWIGIGAAVWAYWLFKRKKARR